MSLTPAECKELKARGFPQEPAIDISGIDGPYFGGFYYIIRSGDMECAPVFLDQRSYLYANRVHKLSHVPTEVLKIPMLLELIEQCGDAFTRLDSLHDQNKFIAYSADSLRHSSESPRPEAAVKNLWLSLNP